MIAVIRQHLPPARAHILAGVLSSAGIKADVWGDQAAHNYGELVTGGCSVAIDDEQREEAEEVLGAADFAWEGAPAADTEMPAETCPPNGDLPGIGVILYGTLRLAPLAAIIPAVLVGIEMWGLSRSSFEHAFRGMISVYVQSLVVLAISLPIYATGAGLLLYLIPAYRRGSRVVGLVAKAIVLLLILATLLTAR